MTCDIMPTPDGSVAIVCTRGRRAQRCQSCGRSAASLQCDYPLTARRRCDRHLCRACAVAKGPNLDWCPTHTAGGDATA